MIASGASSTAAVQSFDSTRTAGEAGRLVIWLIVLVETMFFGGLLCAYAVLKDARPEVFAFGEYFMDSRVAAIANAFLLVSGFFAALAVRFAQNGKPRQLLDVVAFTLVCGAATLAIRGVELSDKIESGLLPGRYFHPTNHVWEREGFIARHKAAALEATRLVAAPNAPKSGAMQGGESKHDAIAPLHDVGVLGAKAVFASRPSEPKNAHTFFSLFFVINGLLLLHFAVGLGVWVWLFVRIAKRNIERQHWCSIDHACVFWNMGAVLSVLIFPLFYSI